MTKPLTELFPEVETVEDAIHLLLQLPKSYTLHPLGQKCQIGVDHVHECVYMEDPNCIGEYTEDVLEEARNAGEPITIEVPDEKLEVYKPSLFIVMGYSDELQNGGEQARLMGAFSTEELATECGEELVECGEIIRYEIEAPIIDEFGFK